MDQVTDHDDFGSTRSKIINVIDSNSLEHDVVRKPLRNFGIMSDQSGDGDGKDSENEKDRVG